LRKNYTINAIKRKGKSFPNRKHTEKIQHETKDESASLQKNKEES
jgi:hypothetical protein